MLNRLYGLKRRNQYLRNLSISTLVGITVYTNMEVVNALIGNTTFSLDHVYTEFVVTFPPVAGGMYVQN